MELPQDILQIIKEYAKPVTRPDWRTVHIMPDLKQILYEHPYFLSDPITMYYIKIKRIAYWLDL